MAIKTNENIEVAIVLKLFTGKC